MHNIEEKQTIWNLQKLKHQQQTSSIDHACARLDPKLPSDDSAYDETNDVPNNFVHLRDDGEFNPSIHPKNLWKMRHYGRSSRSLCLTKTVTNS